MSDEKDLKLEPTDGLCYNPNLPLYWDEGALKKELDRSFELCHSCRMCFKFCPSFPTLFKAVDEHGGVRALPDATVRQIVDECFQCKLCYTQCPYTDKESHPFRLDFPRLLMRAKAIRRKKEGIPLRDKLMADPDRMGKVGCATAALANWGNTLKPNRVLMEAFGGIHRDKLLPRFASETFPHWFEGRSGGGAVAGSGERTVVLFSTCFVAYNNPDPGKAAVEVLNHNGCAVACPKGLVCCGMPALDAGDIALAREKAKKNVEILLPWVEKGCKVAVVNPTCSLMMKEEYPELLNDPADPGLAEKAKKVAAGVRDLGEYLWELKGEGAFKEDFKSTPNGPVAYHAPCHLRMQNVGFRGRDLLRRIPGVKPKPVVECCGHDGTWAMKKEFFQISLGYGQKAFDGMKDAGAEVWASDCPLAALQFEQACGKRPLHPVEILAKAYREDGFETRVPPAEGKPKGE